MSTSQPESSTAPNPAAVATESAPASAFTDPNSRLAPYFLQASHLAIVAILAASFLLLSLLPVWHTDVWGHMQFGRWMVQNGKLAAFEAGDKTFGDLIDKEQPYVNFQWLSQVLFYVSYQFGEKLAGGDAWQQAAGGVAMLRLLTALVHTLKLLFLAIAFYRLTQSSMLTAAGLLATVLLSLGHFGVLRPQIFAEVCLAALLIPLSRPQLSVRGLVLIPLIMVLWANLHGSYLVGLVVIGAFVVGRTTDDLLIDKQNVLADRQLRRLFLAAAAAFAGVACLNPHGPWLFVHTFELSANPNIADMDEWKPIWFHSDGILLYLFVASAALVGITQYLSPRWFTPTQVLLILGIGVQTVLHERMMSWWTMIVPWVVLPHWVEILKPYPETSKDPTRPDFFKTMIAVLVVWLAIMFSSPMNWLQSGQPAPLDKAMTKGTPWRLAAQLREPGSEHLPALDKGLKAAGYRNGKYFGRIFASETQGDYLLYALDSKTPIFVYTHVHLYPPAIWNEAKQVKNASTEPRGDTRAFTRILNDPKYRINMLLFEPDIHPALRDYLLDPKQSTWLIVHYDKEDSDKESPKDRQMIAVRRQTGFFKPLADRLRWDARQ